MLKLPQLPGRKSTLFAHRYGAWRRRQRTPPTPYSPSSTNATQPMKRKIRPLRIALITFIGLLLLGGSLYGAGYYYYYNTIHQPLTQFIRPVTRGANEPPPNVNASYDGIKGRAWNILLLGSDNDGKYSFPAVLTQVMMVVHIDPDANSVSLVSIPRDSWVWVPEVGGMHKIDQAFFLGASQSGKFEDGVRMARLTIEKDYGITIDRYGWVGLDGFARVIDTLGGIDIDVTHPIVDDLYPDDTNMGTNSKEPFAYKRLYMEPGPQHLNGTQALEYVRTRHGDLVGDIGRTERQQQVLQALKLKLNATSIMKNLPALFKDLTGQVYTDLSEQEMIDFANFGRVLDTKSIERITLGPGKGDQNYGEYANVYDTSLGQNQSVILPHCDTIQPLINRIFEPSLLQRCNVQGP